MPGGSVLSEKGLRSTGLHCIVKYEVYIVYCNFHSNMYFVWFNVRFTVNIRQRQKKVITFQRAGFDKQKLSGSSIFSWGSCVAKSV